jgi:hypothetical protein
VQPIADGYSKDPGEDRQSCRQSAVLIKGSGALLAYKRSLTRPRFTVTFNGSRLFDVEDTTFMDGGMVGLWTKADSVTACADFLLEEKK